MPLAAETLYCNLEVKLQSLAKSSRQQPALISVVTEQAKREREVYNEESQARKGRDQHG